MHHHLVSNDWSWYEKSLDGGVSWERNTSWFLGRYLFKKDEFAVYKPMSINAGDPHSQTAVRFVDTVSGEQHYRGIPESSGGFINAAMIGETLYLLPYYKSDTLLKSTDLGLNWSIATGFPEQMHQMEVFQDVLFFRSFTSVYVLDSTETLQKIELPINPNGMENWTLFNGGSMLYLGITAGSKKPWTWYKTDGFTVSNEASPQLPPKLSLSTFPNPFNPSTTVSVSGLSAGEVTVTVLDVLGRTVEARKMRVFNSEMQFSLDLSAQASGIYLIRAMQGKQELTKKITLVK